MDFGRDSVIHIHVAEQTLDAIGEPWSRVEVDGSIELERDYGDRVPVVLLDGREHGYWRVEEGRLRDALAGRRWSLR